MNDDLTACAEITRRGDPDRFRAAMAMPVAARLKLLPLYAFNVEVARAPWVTQEPLIAQMRLQWWHDVLDEIAGDADVRRHEVATPLAAVLTPDQAGALQGLVAARAQDIAKEPFKDEAALWAYLEATSGTLLHVSAGMLGATSDISDLGKAHGVASWLRAIPALKAAGWRAPLPDESTDAVAGLALQGLQMLDDAPGLPRPGAVALLPLWSTRAVLKIAAKDVGADLTLSPFKEHLLLMRAAVLGRY